LTLYAEAGAVATMVLDPIRAIALAQRLIAAAVPRLSLAELQRAPFGWPGNRSPLRAGTRYSGESGAPVP
jgi:hypothetical protein